MLNVPQGIGMIAFAESMGYKYLGDCSCTPRKRIYAKADSKFQIWIGLMQDKMEVRKMFGDRDSRILGVGGVMNFQDVYNYWVNIHGA